MALSKADQWEKAFRRHINQGSGAYDHFGPKGGGGGAADHANSMRWANFVLSGEYATYPNDKAARDAFNLKHYGGATTNLKHGETINDTDFKDAVRRAGGNPYKKGGGGYSRRATPAEVERLKNLKAQMNQMKRENQTQGDDALAAQGNALNQLLQDASVQNQAAKQANLDRYEEGHRELTDLRDRSMTNLEGQGEYDKRQLAKRYGEIYGRTRSALAERGFSDTQAANAKAKAEQDLADAQMGVTERSRDKAAEYDRALTNALVGFVEKRDDTGPDMDRISALIERYGLSNNGQGFSRQGGAGGYQPGRRGQRPVITPFGRALNPTQAKRLVDSLGGGGQNQQGGLTQQQMAQNLLAQNQQTQNQFYGNQPAFSRNPGNFPRPRTKIGDQRARAVEAKRLRDLRLAGQAAQQAPATIDIDDVIDQSGWREGRGVGRLWPG